MSRAELELERRLNDRASKAIHEITPDSNHSFRSRPTADTFSSDLMDASVDLRALQIEAQLAKIATNAIKEKLGFKPSKIKTDVTKEMIDDYQAEMVRPIKIGDHFYKYHPSSVDIDLVEFVALPEMTAADKRAAEELSRRLSTRASNIQASFKELTDAEEETRKTYDDENTPRQGESTKSRINRIPENLRMFNNTMRRIDSERERRRSEYSDTMAALERITEELDRDKFYIGQNRAEKKRVDTLNGEKLKAYSEDINLLNRGRMNVQQDPNESDEAFAQRLKELGQVTVSEDQIISAAEQYNRSKLRDKMKELSRNSVVTSNAVKDLSMDEVYEVNKKFAFIKDAFLKLYGFNNTTLETRDLTEFFRNAIEANPFEAALREAEKFGVQPPEGIRRAATAAEVQRGEVTLPEVLTEETAKRFSTPQLIQWIGRNHPNITIPNVRGESGKQKLILILIDEGIIRQPIASPPLGSSLSGFGIKHDIPNLVEFGRVKISPKKLYYSNVLSVKHKSGSSFNGVPNIRVSDGFVGVIMNLLKGQKPTIKDFNALDLNEKGVYDTLIQTAGLGKEVDNTFNDTKKQLKNRLELVEGEIGAGNTNPDLKAELHHLLGSMAHSGMIGHTDARRHYMNVTGGIPSVTKQRKKRLL